MLPVSRFFITLHVNLHLHRRLSGKVHVQVKVQDRSFRMKGAFYIVGPTAAGKSALAVDVARKCQGEIVSADAFQIYAGLDLLTAKPEPELLRTVPHHLIGTTRLTEEMNAERFRVVARGAIDGIEARGKRAFVVGGNGLYVKALTHGLSAGAAASAPLREQLNQLSQSELLVRLERWDRETAQTIDPQNKRRLTRALEICLLTRGPARAQRVAWADEPDGLHGVFVFRDRQELYERINLRVEMMFRQGVVDEVRRAGEVGSTAGKTLGLQQIRDLIDGRISEAQCIVQIQQATRRYSKRQLTWFRRQSNFVPLNLSRHGSAEAIKLIARKARLSFPPKDD